MNDSKKKKIVILMPVVLIISASFVFYLSSRSFGKEIGYLTGFLFYWLVWCLLIPLMLLGKNILFLFKDKKPLLIKKNWWIIILLLSTIISPMFMYFIPEVSNKPMVVILLSIPLALMNGFFEELFWRGLYVSFFPQNFLMGVIYPSLFFSIWHIVPQLSISSENPAVFVISTIPLGITYGLVAYVTKSAKWSAVSHGISGILAFSGLLAESLYKLL